MGRNDDVPTYTNGVHKNYNPFYRNAKNIGILLLLFSEPTTTTELHGPDFGQGYTEKRSHGMNVNKTTLNLSHNK